MTAVAVLTPAAEATFPGTNGRIAWSRDGDVFTMRPDGSGKRRLTDSPRFERGEWSPNGQMLAVVRERATVEQRARVLLIDPRTAAVTPLGRARYSVQQLSWSPDGTRLAYCDLDIDDFDAPAPYTSAIKVIAVATATQSRLTAWEQKACDPSWSPDSNQLAFHAGNYTNIDIYIMDADGTDQTALTTDTDVRQHSPEWSPTGSVIAYERPIPAPDNQGDEAVVIESIRTDGTGTITLTEPTNAWDGGIEWSPDGNRLLFHRMETTGNYETHLGVVDVDGSGEVLLTTIEPGNMAWSPNGMKIAFVRGGDIFTIGSDGAGGTKLAGRSAFDVYPSWQGIRSSPAQGRS